jgi:predicted alpha/beta hydrolase family esterase
MKLRRLIITGIACPKEPWESFFEAENHKGCENRVLSLADILDQTDSSDLTEMAKAVSREMESYHPDSIISHGFGVPLTLLALYELKKQRKEIPASLTLLNGAFRGLNVFKTSFPWKAQVLPYRRAIKLIQSHGGEIDYRLKPHIPKLRSVYRKMILNDILQKVQNFLGWHDMLGAQPHFRLPNPIQVIHSDNDPYIPESAAEQLAHDVRASRFLTLNYGHFPYHDTKRQSF